VLRADRLVDVVDSEPVADELGRIDPDTERALGGIKRGAADPRDASDLANHVANHEIAEADLVETAVGRGQRDDLQGVARRLFDQNALLHDRARQARLDPFNPVLHHHGGIVEIRPRHEAGGDLDLSQRVAGRFEVEDPGRAVEFLLDETRHAVVEIFRRGARIAGRDRDRRRRDDRILCHWQQRDRDRADQADEQRDDPGEDRPVDEEARHDQFRRTVAVTFDVTTSLDASAASTQASGLTLSPATNFWKPSTTTRSPAFRPSVTSNWPSCSSPVRIGRGVTRLSSLTMKTSLPPPTLR